MSIFSTQSPQGARVPEPELDCSIKDKKVNICLSHKAHQAMLIFDSLALS